MPDWNTLNTLDWIILGIVLWSVGWAALRGFSREIFSILGLIAAFIITGFAGHLLDGPLADMLPDNALARMFSRLIVFLGCIIVINIISIIGAKSLRALLSTTLDHSLGLLFGFIRAALLVVLPFLLVNLYVNPKVYPDWLTEAHSYPFLQEGAQLCRRFMPASQIHDDQRTDFTTLKKATEEQVNAKVLLEEKKAAESASENKKKETKDSSGILKLKDLIKMLKELIAK